MSAGDNSALFGQGNPRLEFLPKCSWWVGLTPGEFYTACRQELWRMVRSPLGTVDKATYGDNAKKVGRPRTTHI